MNAKNALFIYIFAFISFVVVFACLCKSSVLSHAVNRPIPDTIVTATIAKIYFFMIFLIFFRQNSSIARVIAVAMVLCGFSQLFYCLTIKLIVVRVKETRRTIALCLGCNTARKSG